MLELTLNYLSCGVDPEKAILFRQSDVPQVCELTWILNNVTPVGLLERAHSYKDKIAKGFAPNNGLFSYPVLMASDILIYQSNLVRSARIRSSTSKSPETSRSNSTISTAKSLRFRKS